MSMWTRQSFNRVAGVAGSRLCPCTVREAGGSCGIHFSVVRINKMHFILTALFSVKCMCELLVLVSMHGQGIAGQYAIPDELIE